MPRVVGSGGGLSSPVGIADGGHGQTTAAAGRAALAGWTTPPVASAWTAVGSASVADVTGGIDVTASFRSGDAIDGVTRAVSGDFDVAARLNIGGPCPIYSTYGMIFADASGSELALVGVRVEPTLHVGQIYFVRWPGVTPGVGFDVVLAGSRGNLYGRALWVRAARVGSTITVYVREHDEGPWTALTAVNDSTDLGLSSSVTKIGIGMNPVGSGVTPAAVIRCTSWGAP